MQIITLLQYPYASMLILGFLSVNEISGYLHFIGASLIKVGNVYPVLQEWQLCLLVSRNSSKSCGTNNMRIFNKEHKHD